MASANAISDAASARYIGSSMTQYRSTSNMNGSAFSGMVEFNIVIPADELLLTDTLRFSCDLNLWVGDGTYALPLGYLLDQGAAKDDGVIGCIAPYGMLNAFQRAQFFIEDKCIHQIDYAQPGYGLALGANHTFDDDGRQFDMSDMWYTHQPGSLAQCALVTGGGIDYGYSGNENALITSSVNISGTQQETVGVQTNRKVSMYRESDLSRMVYQSVRQGLNNTTQVSISQKLPIPLLHESAKLPMGKWTIRLYIDPQWVYRVINAADVRYSTIVQPTATANNADPPIITLNPGLPGYFTVSPITDTTRFVSVDGVSGTTNKTEGVIYASVQNAFLYGTTVRRPKPAMGLDMYQFHGLNCTLYTLPTGSKDYTGIVTVPPFTEVCYIAVQVQPNTTTLANYKTLFRNLTEFDQKGDTAQLNIIENFRVTYNGTTYPNIPYYANYTPQTSADTLSSNPTSYNQQLQTIRYYDDNMAITWPCDNPNRPGFAQYISQGPIFKVRFENDISESTQLLVYLKLKDNCSWPEGSRLVVDAVTSEQLELDYGNGDKLAPDVKLYGKI